MSMTYCSPLLLNCFDFKQFGKFIGGVVVVPYIIYYYVAHWAKWTRKREKTLSEHYETVVTAMSSMAILWFLGNYEQTFDQTTFIFVIIGILAFGFIAERSKGTHHHTMATMHKWNRSMHIVVMVTILLIAISTVHHMSLAAEVSVEFRNVYICATLIPIMLVYFASKVAQWENQLKSNSDDNMLQSSPKRLLFHLHHVHLFYALAFFTRFPERWSRIAAGLAIGASMHGAAAFGYDKSFENQDITRE